MTWKNMIASLSFSIRIIEIIAHREKRTYTDNERFEIGSYRDTIERYELYDRLGLPVPSTR